MNVQWFHTVGVICSSSMLEATLRPDLLCPAAKRAQLSSILRSRIPWAFVRLDAVAVLLRLSEHFR